MRWNYTTGKQPGNIKALEWYQENELDVMIATAAQSGPAALFPFDVRDGSINARGIPAIKSFVEMASGKGIDGMLCTAWDDRSLHFETLFRGYIASAQYSWSPGSLSLNEYDQTYMQKEYGITARDYGDIYLWLRKAADFWAGAFNRESDRMDIHNALLPLPGIAHFLSPEESEKIKSGNVDYTKKLITLPANENPGQWTEKYQDRLLLAEELMNEYPDISSKLDQFFCYSKRNRYHWEVFRAVNDFQITAPKLLLALQECDKNNPRQRSAGIKKVQNALEEFHQSWENLKKVYSKTRFFSYPSNYVSDRYYHFASQREDLSWMIQVEELFHRMIQEWMVENNVESESSS